MASFYRRILDDPSPYDLPVPPIPKCGDDDIDHCSTKDEDGSSSNLPFSPILLIVICILVAFFFLICYFIILKRYRFRLNSLRRTFSRNIDQDENIMNEDHGPELIHPIWLINTIGLTQMVIDSIAIIKYKKGEGLVEEADCTICLSEFQDDESLRLLPKCSHAFHIACIDTWLRSHKNCPLCRAPIVVEASNAGLGTVETANSDGLSAGEENLVENSDSNGEDCDGAGNNGAGESTNTSNEERGENTDKTLVFPSARTTVAGLENEKGEGGSQEVRRSVSLDSFSASMISIAVANMDPVKVVKHGKNKSSSRIYGVMKSSSFRHLTEIGHVSMKRTFSSTSTRKWPKPGSSKSHDSILPL